MLYQDKDGREFSYQPTQSSVMRAEERSGVSLLGALADAQNEGGSKDQMAVRLSNKLASIKVAASLLYEALPPEDRRALTFDDFVDSFEPMPFSLLIGQVVSATLERFGDDTAPAETGGEGSGPKERLPEAKSSESSESPEPAPTT